MISFSLAEGGKVFYDADKNQLYCRGQELRVIDQRPAEPLWQLRLSLGKRCNFKCAYCLQAPVKAGPEARLEPDVLAGEIIRFLGERKLQALSFWGGEPFLYFEAIERLQQKLRPALAPGALCYMVTNGSFLAEEKIWAWITEHISQLHLTLSYDGPGQSLRGRDVLAEPLIRQRAGWLLERGRLSFNAVLSGANCRVKEYKRALSFHLGPEAAKCSFFEPLQIVDESSEALAASEADLEAWLWELYGELLGSGSGDFMPLYFAQAQGFLSRLGQRALAPACQAGSERSIFLDSAGRLLICQNQGSETAPLGHISELGAGADYPRPRPEAIKKRWRTLCAQCQTRHLCGGGCLLSGDKYLAQNCVQQIYKQLLTLMLAVTMAYGRPVEKVEIHA